ncbi:MAG: putative metal-binding motif-containing protein [Nitrospirae bacterium]|nr:putative metal-binding motif-containing protein [Nitrospirota bacterium]
MVCPDDSPPPGGWMHVCSKYRVWNETGSRRSFMITGQLCITDVADVSLANMSNGSEITTFPSTTLDATEVIYKYLQRSSCGTLVDQATYNDAIIADLNADCCVTYTDYGPPYFSTLVDRTCPAGIIDNDGDGYTTPADCNDSDTAVHPGAAEAICNGIDNDCDGNTDEDYVVNSNCGVGICQENNTPSSCVGGVETACAPGSPTQTPEATCTDSIDNDCDGLTDALDQNCFCYAGGVNVRNSTGANKNYFKNAGACQSWSTGSNVNVGTTDTISVLSTSCVSAIRCTVDYPYLHQFDSDLDCQIHMTSNNPCTFIDE